jgi:hypothetical protein
MPLFLRVVAPEFDPGATVEDAGVAPHSAHEGDVAKLDERLVNLLHPELASEEKPEPASAPPTAEQAAAAPAPPG